MMGGRLGGHRESGARVESTPERALIAANPDDAPLQRWSPPCCSGLFMSEGRQTRLNVGGLA